MLPTDDLLGRIDTAALYQPFCEKLNGVLNACAARGAYYVATCGERTWEEQNKLYARGRTSPGGIVTKAPGGFSPHNFAVAVDFCRDMDGNWGSPGLKPDYRDASYEILAQEAERLGLEAGLRWRFRDSPHLQIPLKAKGIGWDKLRSLYHQGGKQAVFAFLDQFSW